MSKSIISEGKNLNEAIEKGLNILGLKNEDVEIKVLEDEKKIFYSILTPRKVKVEIKVKEDIEENENMEEYIQKLNEFLEKFVSNFDEITYKIRKTNEIIFININGKNSYKLIGKDGAGINALQSILISVSRLEKNSGIKLSVDISNYRDKKDKKLISLAKKSENIVAKTGEKLELEPMNAYERCVIHRYLEKSDVVKTYSVGEEPNRRLVIDIK